MLSETTVRMKPVLRIFFIVVIGAGAVMAGWEIMAAITYVLGLNRSTEFEWGAGGIAAAFWFVVSARDLRTPPVPSPTPKPRSLELYAVCIFPFAYLMEIGEEVVANRPVIYSKELIGGILMTATLVFVIWHIQRKALTQAPPPVVAEKPKVDS